jgi:predicted unusual protein kinase regulating ubiquinone biosynthesis (AarF/ABC1/UbiB family)
MVVSPSLSTLSAFAAGLRRPRRSIHPDTWTVKMGISLKPDHLRRYAQIARVLARHGRSDLVREMEIEDALLAEDGVDEPTTDRADELAADLERLGPTFIKLGQLLSTRADLLPLSYTEALARLQDDVEPFPYEEVERILTEEMGVRPGKIFHDLEREPIAAASLGQVHRARLRDGRAVAIKVQRPGIRKQVAEDMDALEELAELFDSHTAAGRRYEFTGILHEMRASMMQELDYRREARNLTTLGENLAEFERIVVPRPVEDFTTSRVLTMEFMEGRKITAVGPLARLEMDGVALADQLFEAYLKQILVDGFFHADPHPGNVFLGTDGRIALIDVGMVGRLTPELQDQLMRLLLSLSDGRGEEAAEVLAQVGERLPDFDESTFEREIVDLVVTFHGASARQLQIGGDDRGDARRGRQRPASSTAAHHPRQDAPEPRPGGAQSRPRLRAERGDPASCDRAHAATDAEERFAGERLLQHPGDERVRAAAPVAREPRARRGLREPGGDRHTAPRRERHPRGAAEGRQPYRDGRGAGGADHRGGDAHARRDALHDPRVPGAGDALLRRGRAGRSLAGHRHSPPRQAGR